MEQKFRPFGTLFPFCVFFFSSSSSPSPFSSRARTAGSERCWDLERKRRRVRGREMQTEEANWGRVKWKRVSRPWKQEKVWVRLREKETQSERERDANWRSELRESGAKRGISAMEARKDGLFTANQKGILALESQLFEENSEGRMYVKMKPIYLATFSHLFEDILIHVHIHHSQKPSLCSYYEGGSGKQMKTTPPSFVSRVSLCKIKYRWYSFLVFEKWNSCFFTGLVSSSISKLQGHFIGHIIM